MAAAKGTGGANIAGAKIAGTKTLGGAAGKGATIVAGKGTGLVGHAAAPGGSALTGAKALATGGTIWTGKGLSLGLGIGLGAMGPLLVLAGGAAIVYGCVQYYKQREQHAEPGEEGEELNDAFSDDEPTLSRS
ncbi:magnetic particle specific iron-binding protein [Rhodovastum atsumiense]|nr:magnetic particle specific iron-binding protein [Rhodovastum atsumiense]